MAHLMLKQNYYYLLDLFIHLLEILYYGAKYTIKSFFKIQYKIYMKKEIKSKQLN